MAHPQVAMVDTQNTFPKRGAGFRRPVGFTVDQRLRGDDRPSRQQQSSHDHVAKHELHEGQKLSGC